MYSNNINLRLTFLGLFLIKIVFGAPGNSSLAKNQGELKIIHVKRMAPSHQALGWGIWTNLIF